MKLLVDMNLSPRWVDVLSAAGIEATHWSNLGAANAPDVLIMAFAGTHDFVVMTHDLDFGAILAATQAASLAYSAAVRRSGRQRESGVL